MMKYIKIGLVVFLLLFLFLLNRRSHTKDVDVISLASQIVSGSAVEMKEGTEGALRRFYGVDRAQVESYVLYIPDTVMSVDELLIVKTKNNEETEVVKKAMEARVETQKKSFESYGTTQMGVLKQAVVKTKGNYAFLAISKNAKKWYQQFLDAVANGGRYGI